MRLLAPVSSMESCVSQIRAGAEEIYLAADTNAFRTFSFTGRGKFSIWGKKIAPDFTELADIVAYAHERSVSVMYTANLPFLADDPSGTKGYEKAFLEYVLGGIAAGVDTVILGDIGAMILLKEEGIQTPITSSTFLEPANKASVDFLKELNVTRIVLSYHVTLPEIRWMVEHGGIEVEVFGHYGCSFLDGCCNLKHGHGESKEAGIGLPCQANYALIQNGTTLSRGRKFAAALHCSLCSLPDVSRSGAYALKLVGRDLPLEQNVMITNVYSKLLKYIRKSTEQSLCGVDNRDYHEYRRGILPPWWPDSFCKNKTCRHLNREIIESFVES